MIEATDELDATIAAKIISDEYVAAMDRAFWQAIVSIRKTGDVSVNEICRRIHAAGIASKPTTLSKLTAAAAADVSGSLATMGTQFRETVAILQRNADVIGKALAEEQDDPEE